MCAKYVLIDRPASNASSVELARFPQAGPIMWTKFLLGEEGDSCIPCLGLLEERDNVLMT